MKRIASLSFVGVLAAVLSVAHEAGAQSPAQRSPPDASKTTSTTVKTADYTEHSVAGDQVVTFTGDELPGELSGAYGGTIRPLPGAARVGLIRPRMNFVPELLKSVENL